jgi:hypothetical protein
VIVAESAPHMAGQEMAKALAEAGIDTTVVSDSAVYAIMARVNQVSRQRRRGADQFWCGDLLICKSMMRLVPLGMCGIGSSCRCTGPPTMPSGHCQRRTHRPMWRCVTGDKAVGAKAPVAIVVTTYCNV